MRNFTRLKSSVLLEMVFRWPCTTLSMETLLEDGRKKRKGRHADDDAEEPVEGRKKRKDDKSEKQGDDVKGLVARLKSKNKSGKKK